MVAASTSGPGLSPADLDRIRDTLASGRKPKVSFTKTAGQIAGQIGQVIALTDPSLSDEWVVVRFGRDELPFAPTDVSLPVRSPSARRGSSMVPTPRVEISENLPSSSLPPPPMISPKGVSSVEQTKTSEPKVSVKQADVPSAAEPAKSKATSRKAVRQKPPASLTVTLSYTDGEWMVSASQGARVVAKPYAVRPSEALKMVGLLDVPGVHEAVAEIVAAARTEAQIRADRLRAELAEVEAHLEELRE